MTKKLKIVADPGLPLLLRCGGPYAIGSQDCSAEILVPQSYLASRLLPRFLNEKRWILSAAGDSKPTFVDVLCPRCASALHHPETVATAREHLAQGPVKA